MKTTLHHYPTVQELRALEVAAHRERAREVARLLGAGAAGLKALVGRFATLHDAGRISHA